MESLNKNQSNLITSKWIFTRTKKYLPLVIIISVIAVLSAMSTIYLALLSKDVLDIATKNKPGNFGYFSIGLLVLVVLQILLIASETYLKAYANGKLTIELRDHLFRIASRRKYSDITKYHSGDFLNRFTSDIEVVINSVVNIMPSVASILAKLIGGISTMLVLDSRIAIIILVAGILVPALGRIINRKYKKLHKQCQKTEGDARSFVQECFENIVVLKTFNGENSLGKRLNHFLFKNYRLKMKRSLVSLFTHISLYALFSVGYYGVMIWGAGQISQRAITYGTLMAFLQLVQQLRVPMQNVSGILPQYYSAIASAERLIEIEKGDYDPPAIEKSTFDSIAKNFTGIEFKNICFAYNDELIIEDCTLEIPRGKITAIIGESGSGKSTLFKLILKLYDVQSGKITVNGNIELDASLRGLFAYVPQGNMVLSGSIRENITLYNSSISEEEIIKAAKTAEIYNYIASLPDGLDTILSERGAGLSEGQIQRISIARALLTNAPVLLLDEATSALDELTETKVLDNIKALSDKTVLFVTHRNTSLKVCDRIVNIKNKVFSVIKE